jgi:hypothetical protein
MYYYIVATLYVDNSMNHITHGYDAVAVSLWEVATDSV